MITLSATETRFRERASRSLECVALGASVLAGGAVCLAIPAAAGMGSGPALLGAGLLLLLTLFYAVLAQRWQTEWLVYGAELALVGAYLVQRAAHPMPESWNAGLLAVFAFLEFGVSEALERHRLRLWSRPTFLFSLLMPLLSLSTALASGRWDEARLIVLFSSATFYGLVGFERRWKPMGYVAAALYNLFLWSLWARVGWRLAECPQLYLIPVGLSAILFAEVNRAELERPVANAIRTTGSTLIYLSTAVPMWQFQSFGAWLTLLLLSLAGILVGIGLRVQSFVWLGLFCFVFDLLYQLGRAGMSEPLAKWAIMLALGVALILFVALNEKKRLSLALRECFDEVRSWD